MKNTVKKLIALTLVLCTVMTLLCGSALAAGCWTAAPVNSISFKVETKPIPFAIAPCLTLKPVSLGYLGPNSVIHDPCWGFYDVTVRKAGGGTEKYCVQFLYNSSSYKIYLKPNSTYTVTVKPRLPMYKPAEFMISGSCGVKSIR